MKKYIKYISAFILFFTLPIVINMLLPKVGSNNIIDLILRTALNALLLLTIIYIFIKDIHYDLKKLNKKSIINIFLYLFILLLSIVFYKITLYLMTNIDLDYVVKIDILYKKIPVYIFINSVILMPLSETLILRKFISKIIDNKFLLLIVSTIMFGLYFKALDSVFSIYLIITTVITTMLYIKDENIITTTITATLFNLAFFLVNIL